uniref:Periplasmic chaperone PpiD n=1 Tax=Candidatus Kentrum sp. SD TaxID=2126332 RepID=A0A451BJX2_9GAMM|nr:MAG: peptidyl-prolyl cis-trans isomerase D [Candidatus Kentron sp. SD]VFK40237.1 MAG: peptidyl-prolyl cis-trans isomerase D [Candidatus Kentron sp. SD]VFK78582.1 MAG: peptidyl-prolyl cis-trans isomerase D [Candidatus Kentron sp. SD]
MLQDIRDRAQGWIAWLLVLFISIPFALWGIHEYLGSDPNIPVAEIDGDELGLRQFQQAYRDKRRQLQSIFGEDFDISMLNERELKKNTLNGLIDNEVLLRTGIDNGLRIGDEQLARIIQSERNFREEDRFSDAKYQQWLRMSGYSMAGFEYEYRRSLLMDQIRLAIVDTAIVGEKDIENTIRLKDQERIASLLTIPNERYSGNGITEEAILDYYENNRGEFVTRERISVDYLELSLDDLPNVPDPSEENLRALYENQKVDYIEPEQRRARHILLRLDPEANETAVATVRDRLVEVKRRLKKGDAFEDLAKEYSEDPGSASQGGDLGFFGVGVMDREFEAAVYSLAKGEVSEPIRSRFGLHLIELTEIRPSTVHPFEKVRDKLLQDFQRHQKEQQFFEQAEQLANLTFENPDTLAIAADALGLDIKETGFFDRAGSNDSDDETPADGTLKNRKFIDAAFSEDVLNNGSNSEPVELDGHRVIVLHKKDRQPASPKPMETVRDEISAILDAKQAREQAIQLGEELMTQLQDGADPASISKTHELTLREKVAFKRRNSGEAPEITERVFRMPHPRENHSVYDSLITAAGDFVIIALQEVRNGNPPDSDAPHRIATRDSLTATYGNEEYRTYVRALRAETKIRIHENNL